MQKKKQDNIIIYKDAKKGVDLKVRMEGETVWLTLDQISEVFGRDKSVISRHIKNVFQSGELQQKSVVAKNATTASDGKTYQVDYYNLDMIISVGYRVNSKQATAFRKWATSVLKKYLLDGYAINKKRLQEAQKQFSELQNTIMLLQEKAKRKNLKGQESEILSLLGNYARSLTLLEQFDTEKLADQKGRRGKFVLDYEKARSVLDSVRGDLLKKKEASELFASERGGAFSGIIGNAYQTFGGKELYPSVEAKAAHLLYFIIKDHPFSDGNQSLSKISTKVEIKSILPANISEFLLQIAKISSCYLDSTLPFIEIFAQNSEIYSST